MEIPHAPVKDLRSTGYFFDELKAYSASSDIDLSTYCTSFVVPYLGKESDSYDKVGHFSKSRMLKLAIHYLSNQKDQGMVDAIFGLQKIAMAEVGKAEKADFSKPLDKTETFINRQKLQAAKVLVKMMVNIIKMFRLAEPNVGLRKSNEVKNIVFDSIIQSWEGLESETA